MKVERSETAPKEKPEISKIRRAKIKLFCLSQVFAEKNGHSRWSSAQSRGRFPVRRKKKTFSFSISAQQSEKRSKRPSHAIEVKRRAFFANRDYLSPARARARASSRGIKIGICQKRKKWNETAWASSISSVVFRPVIVPSFFQNRPIIGRRISRTNWAANGQNRWFFFPEISELEKCIF